MEKRIGMRQQIVEYAQEKGIDMVVGPEARGFIVGCPVAYQLGVGFAPVRKKANCHGKRLKQNMKKSTVWMS